MAHNPMNDTLDFVKNLWGSMSVPGLTAPTLSVEELDKKINDLKAVEAWLNLNMSMLRGSIQALEVQRGTIATLKSVGASLASAVNTGVNDKSIFESNPYASAFFHHAREADKAQAAPEAPAPTPEPEAKPEASKPSAGAAGGQPNAWWNMLQEQFKQAVSTAMASESMMTDAAVKFAAAAAGASAPPAGKPAASTPGATGSAAAKAANAPAASRKPAAKKHPARKAAAKPAVKPADEKP
jgi:hypothetical protein